jgi:uncharacterized protein (DUF302 family)
MKYFFNKKLNTPSFEKAVEQVTEELKKRGFGILNEINLQATLQKKLDVDFKPYKILNVYNSQLAHQASQAKNKIGILLPCNIIIEKHSNSEIEVAALDPMTSIQAVKNEALQDITMEVRQRLK